MRPGYLTACSKILNNTYLPTANISRMSTRLLFNSINLFFLVKEWNGEYEASQNRRFSIIFDIIYMGKHQHFKFSFLKPLNLLSLKGWEQHPVLHGISVRNPGSFHKYQSISKGQTQSQATNGADSILLRALWHLITSFTNVCYFLFVCLHFFLSLFFETFLRFQELPQLLLLATALLLSRPQGL